MSDLPAIKQSTSQAAAMLLGSKVQETQQGGQFLKFDAKRTGEWLLGRESDTVTDEIFSLDLQSLQHGWVLWHNKKADRRLVPINEPVPAAQEPIQYTNAKGKVVVDEPSEARSFSGTLSDGETFTFEGSTYGARKAVDAVLIDMKMRAASGNEFFFPQVQLLSESYEHDTYGQVFSPVLKAVAWFNGEGEEEGVEAQLEAPVVEEPEEVETAVTQRRRRRSQ